MNYPPQDYTNNIGPTTDEMEETKVEEAQQVFIKDDSEAWIAAVIISRSKTEVICRTNNGEVRTVKFKEFRKAEIPYVNSAMVADLVNMKYLHEPGVLVNLISRHDEGKPYTRSRDVVVSINPFRWLHHLYSETNQKLYAEKLIWQITERDPRQDLEPHIYEVSALAYSEMAYQGRNQSIIITGESGSGKTESVKLMMHHLASIQLGSYQKRSHCLKQPTSTSATTNSTCSNNFSNVVDRILNTTPLLEAFGNALTAQNENSSRFGKHVQLQFNNTESLSELSTLLDKRVAILVGSFCDIYLLETSRVCTHANNERTYHIFYQLLAAPNNQKALIWDGIVGKNAIDFKYVGTPITNTIDGVTDEIKFSETWSAFSRIGISVSDTIMLLQALCIVLQLGNVEFTANEFSDDRTEVSTKSEFSVVSVLLGIDNDQLLSAFTQRTMTTRNETFKVPLSVSSAIEARDALAKHIYLNAFTWLTDTINAKTRTAINPTEKDIKQENGIIGLLDIFGFEAFAINRFEQLCINYANEKLQSKAIGDIFGAVREEYELEGISLDLVEVVSNEQLLHLFDGRSGLIALLNEESYRPKGNSKAFTAKVIENFKSSPLVTSPNVGIYNQFGIAHYAGTVIYTTDNFLISNQDTLPLDLKICVSKSQNLVVTGSQKSLLPHPVELREPTTLNSKTRKEVQHPSRAPSLALSLCSNVAPVVKGDNISIGRRWELKREKYKEIQRTTTETTAEICKNSITNDSLNPNPWKDMRMRTSKKPAQTEPKLYERQPSCSNLMAATVWTKYRTQLNSLMQTLNKTHSRYVRCIKPNADMNPWKCDRVMISKQLRYTGLVPTIALSRAMFTKSISNKIFLKKFRCLWDMQNYPSKTKRLDTHETRRKLECEALLLSVTTLHGFDTTWPEITEIPYAVGKTRSYFRQGVLEWLESTRSHEFARFAIILQKLIRRRLATKKYTQMKISARYIQVWIRMKKSNIASMKIQKTYRASKKRKYFFEVKKCAVVIQKNVRCYRIRKNFRESISKVTTIQCWYRKVKKRCRKNIDFLASVVLIQRWYRNKTECYGWINSQYP